MLKVKNQPSQTRSQKTKQSILDAASELFDSKGYSTTTSKDIAEKANVSIGTFYLYFEDKKVLFKEVTQIYYAKFTTRLNEILGQMDFEKANRRDVIGQFVEALLRAHDIWQGFHDELCVMIMTDPEFKANSRRKADESRASIEKYLQLWREKLSIENIPATAALLYELGHSVVDAITYKKSNIPDEDLKQVLVSSMERILFSR